MESDKPLAGIGWFETTDNKQLAGFPLVGMTNSDGLFAKMGKSGFTGIAILNTEKTAATVSLTAYDAQGASVAIETFHLDPRNNIVDFPENYFFPDISDAAYIGYSSDKGIAGFQLNGSPDSMLLDALPLLF